jgi:hypothetical protein
MHVGDSHHTHGLLNSVQRKVLGHHFVVNLQKASIFVIQLGRSVLISGLGTGKKVTLHGLQNGLFLLFDKNMSFVNIVLHPAKVLLGRIAQRENIPVFSQNWTNEIITRRRGNINLTSSIGLVVDNRFDVVEWFS